ncbi:hypothetical protein D9R12_12735 [Pseudoxanthomonas spadix]|nr:hypothetical protein D9R12_12735 [Pseudoxanthomonas spadix]
MTSTAALTLAASANAPPSGPPDNDHTREHWQTHRARADRTRTAPHRTARHFHWQPWHMHRPVAR